AVNHRHVCLGSGANDVVFQAANGFGAQRNHHAGDDFLGIEFLAISHVRLEQLVGGFVDHFLRLAFLVFLVLVEAHFGLLAVTLVFVHDFRHILEVVLHAVREAVGHHACCMNAGVDADHVHQVGRAHRPAELFHHLVDGLEVGAVAHQHAEAGEVREQYAVNEEARAVVDDDRVLAHFLRVGNQGGDGFVGGLLTTDDFHQRHHVHRVEEVHAGKVFRLLQRSGEMGDGNGRGVGGQYGAVLQLAFGFGQYGLLDLRVFDNRFNNYVDILEVTVVQGRADGREHLAHPRAVDLLALQLLGEQLAGFAHAQVQRRVGDVLHDDRRALGGRLVGDTATHDAGTEYRGQVDVLGAFLDVVAIGFFHRLVGEEQANQRSRLRGLGNLGKTFRFGRDRK